MADFVGLLKKAIDAQSNVTAELRQRIYSRVRATVKRKLESSNISAELVEFQLKVIEKAINEVEEFYSEREEISVLVSSEIQKSSSLEGESFLKLNASAVTAKICTTNEQEEEPQQVLLDTVSILPQGTVCKKQFSKTSANNDMSEHSFFALSGRSEFIGSNTVFPFALEASSLEVNRDKKTLGTEKVLPSHLDFTQNRIKKNYDNGSYTFLGGNAQKQAFLLNIPSIVKNAAGKGKACAKNVIAESRVAVADMLPEYVKPRRNFIKQREHAEAHITLPTFQKRREDSGDKRDDNFPLVAAIFSKDVPFLRRFCKKWFLLGGIIVTVLCIFTAIIYFLIIFSYPKEQITAISTSDRKTAIANRPQKEPQFAKITSRLMPDGEEVNLDSVEESEGYGIFNDDTSKIIAQNLVSETAETIYYEAATSLLPKTVEKGAVKWSLLTEKTKKNQKEMAIHGDVAIPGKGMAMQITIQRNTNPSISAKYLIELIFTLSKNFDGGDVNRINQLLFKSSEQLTGQELQGIVPFRIDDNFFILAMDAPELLLRHNLNIISQSSWIDLNITYKNGRTGEISLAKGEKGDAIFKKVLDKKE
ncbi:MAG: hypothetical protein JSC188_000656 [Candidatus Tokpelaia sp. JSC188]|nr:MAG: hypothetical protein JSC188_000656 [Candidatus Tokpelaia sp. JSC188]